MFLPPAALRPPDRADRTLPTAGWPCGGPDATMLRGVVHDPTARRMGGVAGHAGLFSTAADLSRFCRMLLERRDIDGVAPAVAAHGGADDAAGDAGGDPQRARARLGHRLAVRVNRGELFPIGSFGHTGFTGHVALDRPRHPHVRRLPRRTACIPDGKGDVTPLRAPRRHRCRGRARRLRRRAPRRASTWAVTSARPCGGRRPRAPRHPVLNGIDVLGADGFAICAASASGSSPITRGARATARDDRPAAGRRPASPGIALQSRARHSRHPRRGVASTRTRRRACRFTRCTATRGGRPPRCSQGSTQS